MLKYLVIINLNYHKYFESDNFNFFPISIPFKKNLILCTEFKIILKKEINLKNLRFFLEKIYCSEPHSGQYLAFSLILAPHVPQYPGKDFCTFDSM